jgi:FlaA1/EpsC-like NDP-sugar epimerase
VKKKILIYGSGGHSKVVIDAIEKSNQYSIYGVVDDFKTSIISNTKYKYVGDQSCLKKIINEVDGGIVAIGDNWLRSKIVLQIKEEFPNFKFVSVVHPSAIIARGTKIGDGTVVLPGAIVNSD